MARVLLVALLLGTAAHAQNPSRVRREGGRYWVECQSAPLDEMIREFAALSPLELWLDEGLSGKRVTASVKGATLKQALEDLFEELTDVNYVFTLDPANPERVTKIYAGSGGGARLGREPTVAAAEGEEPVVEAEDQLPPEPDSEAQEGLDALRQLVEQPNEDGGQAQGAPGETSSELEELLKNFPELQRELSQIATPTKPAKKAKPRQ